MSIIDTTLDPDSPPESTRTYEPRNRFGRTLGICVWVASNEWEAFIDDLDTDSGYRYVGTYPTLDGAAVAVGEDY